MTWKKQCPCITDLGKPACECRKVEKRIECKTCKYPLGRMEDAQHNYAYKAQFPDAGFRCDESWATLETYVLSQLGSR